MIQAARYPTLSSPMEQARPFPYKAVLWLSVFFIPMKGLVFQVGGQSVYVPFLGLALWGIFCLKPLAKTFLQNFCAPATCIFALSLFYYWQTDYRLDVFVFVAKILILFVLASLYLQLLRQNERAVMSVLFAGAAASIAYMVYQAISVAAFNYGLPFTTIDFLQIGRGLGARYGLIRTTGFTEEPSYIAVMLAGTALLLRSYQLRTGEPQRTRYWILAVGLLLCTSNNLFATLILLAVFSVFYFFNSPILFFALFYAVNLLVAPLLLNIDASFFARFLSYVQFLALPPSSYWFGIGFNQYATLPVPVFVSLDGSGSLAVDSIASLWGGVLLEGGIVFATLFCLYVHRLTVRAQDGAGYALMAILLMLANYYSPWWPIVALALAYSIYSRESRKGASSTGEPSNGEAGPGESPLEGAPA